MVAMFIQRLAESLLFLLKLKGPALRSQGRSSQR